MKARRMSIGLREDLESVLESLDAMEGAQARQKLMALLGGERDGKHQTLTPLESRKEEC